MKNLAFILLFAVGVIQIVFGIILGRLRIYAIEAPFWHELGLTEQHSKAFCRYIGLIKDQWHIVAWLGVITIFSTSLLLWSLKRK